MATENSQLLVQNQQVIEPLNSNDEGLANAGNEASTEVIVEGSEITDVVEQPSSPDVEDVDLSDWEEFSEEEREESIKEHSTISSYVVTPALYTAKYTAVGLSWAMTFASYGFCGVSYAIAGMSYGPDLVSKYIEAGIQDDKTNNRCSDESKVVHGAQGAQKAMSTASNVIYAASYLPKIFGDILYKASDAVNNFSSYLSDGKIEDICDRVDQEVKDLSSKLYSPVVSQTIGAASIAA